MLSGVRIVDLTQMLAGPYGSMLLADLGAEVIKIEEPQKGDPTRQLGPPFVGGESGYFLSINRNKRSMALDLRSARGRRVLYDLIRVSDVLFNNFRPGTMEKLGCDYESLRNVNPRLIYCSLTGFDETGPIRSIGNPVKTSPAEERRFEPAPLRGKHTRRGAERGLGILDTPHRHTAQRGRRRIGKSVNLGPMTGHPPALPYEDGNQDTKWRITKHAHSH